MVSSSAVPPANRFLTCQFYRIYGTFTIHQGSFATYPFATYPLETFFHISILFSSQTPMQRTQNLLAATGASFINAVRITYCAIQWFSIKFKALFIHIQIRLHIFLSLERNKPWTVGFSYIVRHKSTFELRTLLVVTSKCYSFRSTVFFYVNRWELFGNIFFEKFPIDSAVDSIFG